MTTLVIVELAEDRPDVDAVLFDLGDDELLDAFDGVLPNAVRLLCTRVLDMSIVGRVWPSDRTSRTAPQSGRCWCRQHRVVCCEALMRDAASELLCQVNNQATARRTRQVMAAAVCVSRGSTALLQLPCELCLRLCFRRLPPPPAGR